MAHSEHPAVERLLRDDDVRGAFETLGALPGSDLTSLLLEVFHARSASVTPAELLRRYRNDRFVVPAEAPFHGLRAAEDAFLRALPAGFDVITLAPVAPLGTQSAIATVDQNNVVSTIRSTEVQADPTNSLALEAAVRRAELLAERSAERVRLAAFQRVLRAQRFDADGRSFAHFSLLGLVTAGRDVGELTFERESAAEHVRIIVTVLSALGSAGCRVELTDFTGGRFDRLIDHLRGSLTAGHVEVVERPGRPSGQAYYDDFCFKVFPTFGDGEIEVADGGLTDWTRKLVGSEKERLFISGVGLDRVALESPVAGQREP